METSCKTALSPMKSRQLFSQTSSYMDVWLGSKYVSKGNNETSLTQIYLYKILIKSKYFVEKTIYFSRLQESWTYNT